MLTPQLYDKIKYFAKFPQTGVSLRQMVMFGQKPSQGTLYKASQFLHEELPIRLAHRVKELEELPRSLSQMPSIVKVKNWYAESFQDLVNLKSPQLSTSLREQLYAKKISTLPQNVPNPSLSKLLVNNTNKFHPSVPIQHR
jgi:pyruvate dehydrogenase kinase 2/3/4